MPQAITKSKTQWREVLSVLVLGILLTGCVYLPVGHQTYPGAPKAMSEIGIVSVRSPHRKLPQGEPGQLWIDAVDGVKCSNDQVELLPGKHEFTMRCNPARLFDLTHSIYVLPGHVYLIHVRPETEPNAYAGARRLWRMFTVDVTGHADLNGKRQLTFTKDYSEWWYATIAKDDAAAFQMRRTGFR